MLTLDDYVALAEHRAAVDKVKIYVVLTNGCIDLCKKARKDFVILYDTETKNRISEQNYNKATRSKKH